MWLITFYPLQTCQSLLICPLKWGPKPMWCCVLWCSSALLWALRQSRLASVDKPVKNHFISALIVPGIDRIQYQIHAKHWKISSLWWFCFCSSGNLKDNLGSLQAPTSPLFQQSHFTHRWLDTCIFFMFHVNVCGLWRAHVEQDVCGWQLNAFAHFLPQLTQSHEGRQNVYGCKTTVRAIRKDKGENGLNGPGHVCRGGASDSKNSSTALWVVISGQIM